jgi:hypothetical protein
MLPSLSTPARPAPLHMMRHRRGRRTLSCSCTRHPGGRLHGLSTDAWHPPGTLTGTLFRRSPKSRRRCRCCCSGLCRCTRPRMSPGTLWRSRRPARLSGATAHHRSCGRYPECLSARAIGRTLHLTGAEYHVERAQAVHVAWRVQRPGARVFTASSRMPGRE